MIAIIFVNFITYAEFIFSYINIIGRMVFSADFPGILIIEISSLVFILLSVKNILISSFYSLKQENIAPFSRK